MMYLRTIDRPALEKVSYLPEKDYCYDSSGNVSFMWNGISPPRYEPGDLIEIHLARICPYVPGNIMGRKPFMALVWDSWCEIPDQWEIDILILGADVKLKLLEIDSEGNWWNSRLLSRPSKRPPKKGK